MSTSLARVFLAHCTNPEAHAWNPNVLESRLGEVVAQCRTAWPDVEVPERVFVAHLAEHFTDRADLDDGLASIEIPDLYLACGCAIGLPAALAVFDSQILVKIVPVLKRMRLDEGAIDELAQTMRTRLLVATEEPPRIARYAGRGSLVGWVRIAARRAAISDARRPVTRRRASADDLDRKLPQREDPELAFIKAHHRRDFEQAIESAIAALAPEQRNVLRFYYVDNLTIDRIGALLNVHRATAARRVRAAAEVVHTETRRLLRKRLRLTDSQFESLAGLVKSQLHVSIERILDPS